MWDWAYLAGAAFERSPGYTHWQFPGFNRVPDAVHFDVSYLTEEHARLATVLHAPGDLVFTLHGGERTLALDFGYRAGAYENGGGTDGATFAVTVRPADHQPSITLLQKLIQPVEQPADRGNQHVDLVLPANVVAGDELIVSIDPGPRGDASWDWTYLANLHIE